MPCSSVRCHIANASAGTGEHVCIRTHLIHGAEGAGADALAALQLVVFDEDELRHVGQRVHVELAIGQPLRATQAPTREAGHSSHGIKHKRQRAQTQTQAGVNDVRGEARRGEAHRVAVERVLFERERLRERGHFGLVRRDARADELVAEDRAEQTEHQ